jgi:hypothetical protein
MIGTKNGSADNIINKAKYLFFSLFILSLSKKGIRLYQREKLNTEVLDYLGQTCKEPSFHPI